MLDLRIGAVVRLKKRHPCGSEEWEVLRTGVDIRIKCCGCGRVVLLPRERFLRLLRTKSGKPAP